MSDITRENILADLRRLAGLPPSNQTGETNQGDNKFNPVTLDSPENFSPFSKKDESTENEDLLIPLTKEPDEHGQVGVEKLPKNGFDPKSDSKIFVININLSDLESKTSDNVIDQPKAIEQPVDSEEVDEDMGLNNGYHDQVKHDGLDYFDRWAPNGSASTPPSALGPSAARTSDNPEFAGMKNESAESGKWSAHEHYEMKDGTWYVEDPNGELYTKGIQDFEARELAKRFNDESWPPMSDWYTHKNNVSEVAAPGQEDWIKKNKKHFKDEYGDKKGEEVLYATAWKKANESIDDIHKNLVYEYRKEKDLKESDFLGSISDTQVRTDFNAKYNYKPYRGPAGPSDKQVRHFNSLLLKAVTELGADAHMAQNTNYSEPMHEVKVGDRMAGYDRWGYCSDDFGSDHIDQVDLYSAVKYLLGK